MKPLYIIGTGGFAKEVGQLAHTINATRPRWSSIQYLAEDKSQIGGVLPFGKIVGTDELLNREEEVDVAIGIGRPSIRRSVAGEILRRPWLSAPNLIHPRVDIDNRWIRMGVGNIITCGVILTLDIVVGDFNVFNLNCTVGHDASIGNYCVINPATNISGGVKIGDECLIGTGAQILEHVSIVGGTTVGAGAVVVKTIAEPGIYVGVPGRRIA